MISQEHDRTDVGGERHQRDREHETLRDRFWVDQAHHASRAMSTVIAMRVTALASAASTSARLNP